MVYLDYAATTPLLDVMPVSINFFGNSASSHELGQKLAEIEEEARFVIAQKLGADPNQVVFTSGGTESNNFGILGYALQQHKRGEEIHIVYSPIAHKSIIEAVETARDGFGATIEPLLVDKEGCFSPNDVRDKIRKHPHGLLVVDWVNNEIGTIQNVQKLGEICHQNGWWLMVDAVQAFPYFQISFNTLPIDILTISAHKLYGPQGIGALLFKYEWILSPWIMGGTQEGGLRGGTKNTKLIYQFGEAVRSMRPYHVSWERAEALNQQLKELLRERGFYNFNSPVTKPHELPIVIPYIVNIDVGVDSATVVSMLSEQGIYISSGAACGGAVANSHVIREIRGNPSTALRVSFGHETTIEELKLFANSLFLVRKQIKEMMAE